MRVVIAPDSFGGTLSAHEAAAAIAAGWCDARPDDGVELVALSDGGEGLLAVVAAPADTLETVEVTGPLGRPCQASLLLRGDGSAVVESAEACGLHLVADEDRNPLRTTTFGVGQLLDAARSAGARRIVVGLGGSATVDGGAGALIGLGFRLRVADGSGLKIGAADLARVTRADRGWASDAWADIEVELLADVETSLVDAAPVFGPQKGATPEIVAQLGQALAVWADVAVRDLAGDDGDSPALPDAPGTGAAGGLAFGLAAGIGARLRPGARAVADLVGLEAAVAGADLVVTGEGRIDATTQAGKVVAEVTRFAAGHGVRVLAVGGQVDEVPPGVDDAEPAAPGGPGPDPASEVRKAAATLAARIDA